MSLAEFRGDMAVRVKPTEQDTEIDVSLVEKKQGERDEIFEDNEAGKKFYEADQKFVRLSFEGKHGVIPVRFKKCFPLVNIKDDVPFFHDKSNFAKFLDHNNLSKEKVLPGLIVKARANKEGYWWVVLE